MADRQPPSALSPPPCASEPTDFASRWATFAGQVGLPTDPHQWTTMTPLELRQWACEWFSWGFVHGEAMRRRLDELLPDGGRGRRAEGQERRAGSREEND